MWTRCLVSTLSRSSDFRLKILELRQKRMTQLIGRVSMSQVSYVTRSFESRYITGNRGTSNRSVGSSLYLN